MNSISNQFKQLTCEMHMSVRPLKYSKRGQQVREGEEERGAFEMHSLSAG